MAVIDVYAKPELPEDSIVTEAIVIVGYMKPDGTSSWAADLHGTSPQLTYIGLCEAVKHQLLTPDADPE